MPWRPPIVSGFTQEAEHHAHPRARRLPAARSARRLPAARSARRLACCSRFARYLACGCSLRSPLRLLVLLPTSLALPAPAFLDGRVSVTDRDQVWRTRFGPSFLGLDPGSRNPPGELPEGEVRRLKTASSPSGRDKETYLKAVGDHACMAPTADSVRDPTP